MVCPEDAPAPLAFAVSSTCSPVGYRVLESHAIVSERSPELPSGFVNWIGQFLKITDSHVLHHSSMDGYLFLRFLRVLSSISLTGCLITWPILMPIHAVGGAGNTELDLLSFSNVTDSKMYYAHAVVACVFFCEKHILRLLYERQSTED